MTIYNVPGPTDSPFQYWYTMDVPRDIGVYPVQVFTPRLEGAFYQPQIVVLDEPLQLFPPGAETPEPATWMLVVCGLVLWLAGRFNRQRML